MKKKILITGAAGFIGGRLVEFLGKNAYEPVAMLRSPEKAGRFTAAGRQVRCADVRDIGTLETAFQDIDVVVHCAALFNRPEATWQEYRQVNVQGVQNVLTAARRAGVKKVIHLSTVGVAISGEPPYSEASAYNPPAWDKYETTKTEGEKVAREFCRRTGFPVVILRPAQVYGPGDRSKLKFYRMVRKGVLVHPGNTQKHPIYVDDLSRAIAAAIESDAADGQVVIIADKSPVLLREMIKTAGEVLQVRPPRCYLPATPITFFCAVVEKFFNAIGKKPPVFRRSMDFFTKSVHFDPTKARKLLGYIADTDIRTGIERTVQWYQENGLLLSLLMGRILLRLLPEDAVFCLLEGCVCLDVPFSGI